MAKTVNQKGFWFGWLLLMVYLGLLCAVIGVLMVTVGMLIHNPVGAYLASGLLTYMANPRYWTLEYNQDKPYRRDIWIVFLWPLKIPFYIALTIMAVFYRRSGK